MFIASNIMDFDGSNVTYQLTVFDTVHLGPDQHLCVCIGGFVLVLDAVTGAPIFSPPRSRCITYLAQLYFLPSHRFG